MYALFVTTIIRNKSIVFRIY